MVGAYAAPHAPHATWREVSAPSTLVVFTLIGLAITLLGILLGEPALSTFAVINLLLGSVIGLPAARREVWLVACIHVGAEVCHRHRGP